MNLTKFFRTGSHFGIIFEREEGNREIPLYQTLTNYVPINSKLQHPPPRADAGNLTPNSFRE